MDVKCYGLRKEFADRYDYTELAHANRLEPKLIADDVVSLLCK